MSDNIPFEIVNEILTYLPVKSLLRFRSVKKSFKTLIDSTDFIRTHLDRSSTHKLNTFAVTSDKRLRAYNTNNCVLDTNLFVGYESFCSDVKKFVEGDFMGSVNGIVCFDLEDVGVVLWNVATRRWFKVPAVSSETDNGVYSLGYDSVSGNFKVFRIQQHWAGIHDSDGDRDYFVGDIMVFSLKTMSWRVCKVDKLPYPVRRTQRRSVFACGGLHWFLTPSMEALGEQEDKDNLIFAISVGSEEGRFVPMPEYPYQVSTMGLFALDGSLAVVCDYGAGCIDVWVMKEYGVKESWTRLISVDQCQFVRPLTYSKDGHQVLLEKDLNSLVWFGLEEKNVKNTGIRVTPKYSQGTFHYVESLIKLPGGREGTSKKEKTTKERSTKKKDDFLSKGFKLVL